MSNKAFIAMSLDGYIARRDGALDWLPQPGESPGEDYGYVAFMKTIDAVLLGRKTFETVLAMGDWSYAKPVFVLSRSLRAAPAGARAEIVSGEPREVAASLKARGYGNLYVDGGVTIQGFLRAGLLDEITVTVIPVLLGSGIPLFGGLPGDVALTLAETKAYANGLVQIRYAMRAG